MVINYFTLQAGHSVSVRVHFVIVSQSLLILSSQTVVCLCQQVIVKSRVRSEVQHSALGSQSILSAVCLCVCVCECHCSIIVIMWIGIWLWFSLFSKFFNNLIAFFSHLRYTVHTVYDGQYKQHSQALPFLILHTVKKDKLLLLNLYF